MPSPDGNSPINTKGYLAINSSKQPDNTPSSPTKNLIGLSPTKSSPSHENSKQSENTPNSPTKNQPISSPTKSSPYHERPLLPTKYTNAINTGQEPKSPVAASSPFRGQFWLSKASGIELKVWKKELQEEQAAPMINYSGMDEKMADSPVPRHRSQSSGKISVIIPAKSNAIPPLSKVRRKLLIPSKKLFC